MWSDECSFRERHSSSPGSRTSGQTAQDLLIAGPSWHGSVPRNLTLVRSSTNTAFIIGRVYSDGTPPDLAQVQADAMKENPPVMPQDGQILARMAKIGIVPGKPFDMSQLSTGTQQAIEKAPQEVNAQFAKMKARGLGKNVNGWEIPGKCGRFGSDYLNRAVVSAFGWGCNLPEDAVYPITKIDSTGNPLKPVQGFWSITMYDNAYYFYPNALNKLTLGPRNRLQYNADGSLDLYFSHVQPAGVAEANWLPLRTMTSYYACGCIGPRRLHPRYCRRRIHHGHLRQ